MAAGVDHPFDALMRRDERTIRVAEAALLFAVDHAPKLKPFHYLARLDALARRAEAVGAAAPDERLEALREVLVAQERLRGDRRDYYDPRNSLLHEVLDRRVGVPITLSVIWIDVARTLKWPVFGIALPGHFIVGHEAVDSPLLVDPFADGRRLDADDCQKIVDAIMPEPVVLSSNHFRPAPPKAILSRMLNNLRSALSARDEWSGLSKVLDRLAVLHPESAEIRSERARVGAKLASMN